MLTKRISCRSPMWVLAGSLRAAVCWLCLGVSASASLIPVVESGPSSNRVNGVFLGDGYTAADHAAGIYTTHVSNYVNYMFTPSVLTDPFSRYRNFMNLYRIDVVSNESGADVPQLGIVRDTALDATYRYDGVTDRLLYINEAEADVRLIDALAGTGKTMQMKFVTVNQSIYGGGGGNYAVYAGANHFALDVAMHENGHSFSELADEYGGKPGTYPAGEPWQVNVTKSADGAKWSRWLGYNDPTGSVVGAYEGGDHYDQDVYRPTATSKMRNLEVPFNAVSREKIILDIYQNVRPLDAYTSNAGTLVDPDELSATLVDPAVITTRWRIDGVRRVSLDGLTTLDIATLSLSPGPHTIILRAFDPTGFDPVNGWVRTDTHLLEQSVVWKLVITPEPSTFMLLAIAGLIAVASSRGARLPVPSTT